MKEQTRRNCEQLIENRNRVKSVFSWDGGLLNLACGSGGRYICCSDGELSSGEQCLLLIKLIKKFEGYLHVWRLSTSIN